MTSKKQSRSSRRFKKRGWPSPPELTGAQDVFSMLETNPRGGTPKSTGESARDIYQKSRTVRQGETDGM